MRFHNRRWLFRSYVDYFGGLNDDEAGVWIIVFGCGLLMGKAGLINSWVRLENLGWNSMSCRGF